MALARALLLAVGVRASTAPPPTPDRWALGEVRCPAPTPSPLTDYVALPPTHTPSFHT